MCLPVVCRNDYFLRMTQSQDEATEGTHRPRRWRYLIDIVVLVAVTFLLGPFIPVPTNLERGFAFDAIGKMLLVGVSRAEGKLKRRMT